MLEERQGAMGTDGECGAMPARRPCLRLLEHARFSQLRATQQGTKLCDTYWL